ncbi:MAG TPA: hypothetical protein VFJ52_05155 [Terriglobia bacterium]|nr:hypothetical protein [Terriglobia bacterium]
MFELKPVKVVKVPNLSSNSITLPIKCDSDTNIYAQIDEPGDENGRTPVRKLSPDGKVTTFALPAIEGKKGQILSFSPTGDGGLGLLTVYGDQTGTRYYVEKYGKDGQFKSRFRLPDEFEPMRIALSPDRTALISGMRFGAPVEGEARARPFLGLFDAAGELERDVTFGEDTAPADGGPSTANAAPGGVPAGTRKSLEFSSVQFSSDGSFVLARLQSLGPIYTISPDGFALKTIHPSVPSGSHLDSVVVNGSTIAAEFVRMKPGSAQNEISDVFISLINSQTGEQQALYHHSSWKIGPSFACYKDDTFTFLAADENGQLQIVRAAAE